MFFKEVAMFTRRLINNISCSLAGSYMFKVNHRNSRTRCENVQTPCSSVSIVNFEQVNAGWIQAEVICFETQSIKFTLTSRNHAHCIFKMIAFFFRDTPKIIFGKCLNFWNISKTCILPFRYILSQHKNHEPIFFCSLKKYLFYNT